MQVVMVAGLAMFSTVGLVALLCSLQFRWRQYTALIVPIALGFAALAAAGGLWLVEQNPQRSDVWLTWGLFGPVSQSLGWPWLIVLTVPLLVVFAWLAFRLEGWLAARRPKITVGLPLPPELIAANLPARAESMRAVAETAARPVRYWAVSGWTVLGEEIFFRVAAPATLMLSGVPLWVALVVPAALYAANHIGFGLVSVVGKFFLGLTLGVGAALSGAWVVALIHLMYQYWVRRQFDPRSRGGRRVAAAAAP